MRLIYATPPGRHREHVPADAQALEQAVRENQVFDRESYCRDKNGMKTHHWWVSPYIDPDGNVRYASGMDIPNVVIIYDSDDYDEAVTHYEREVRDVGKGLFYDGQRLRTERNTDGTEMLAGWDSTDVDNTPAKRKHA